MRRISLIAAIAIAATVSACEGMGERETVGGLTGAALGGLLGAQFGSGSGQLVATGAGVLVGSEIGRSMDEVDRIKANQAVVRAQLAPLGESITWNNPDSGNYGSITPTRDGTSASGQYCREFQQTITVGGQTEQAYGTACRQPDGSWRIMQT